MIFGFGYMENENTQLMAVLPVIGARSARKKVTGGLFAGGKEMDRKRALAAKERLAE